MEYSAAEIRRRALQIANRSNDVILSRFLDRLYKEDSWWNADFTGARFIPVAGTFHSSGKFLMCDSEGVPSWCDKTADKVDAVDLFKRLREVEYRNYRNYLIAEIKHWRAPSDLGPALSIERAAGFLERIKVHGVGKVKVLATEINSAIQGLRE